MAERETGTVQWFSPFKGYGFTVREGKKDLFVHNSSIRGEGRRALKEGEQGRCCMAQSVGSFPVA